MYVSISTAWHFFFHLDLSSCCLVWGLYESEKERVCVSVHLFIIRHFSLQLISYFRQLNPFDSVHASDFLFC